MSSRADARRQRLFIYFIRDEGGGSRTIPVQPGGRIKVTTRKDAGVCVCKLKELSTKAEIISVCSYTC